MQWRVCQLGDHARPPTTPTLFAGAGLVARGALVALLRTFPSGKAEQTEKQMLPSANFASSARSGDALSVAAQRAPAALSLSTASRASVDGDDVPQLASGGGSPPAHGRSWSFVSRTTCTFFSSAAICR